MALITAKTITFRGSIFDIEPLDNSEFVLGQAVRYDGDCFNIVGFSSEGVHIHNENTTQAIEQSKLTAVSSDPLVMQISKLVALESIEQAAKLLKIKKCELPYGEYVIHWDDENEEFILTHNDLGFTDNHSDLNYIIKEAHNWVD